MAITNYRFPVESAVLCINQNTQLFDIARVIIEFEVFEHIEKPFITASCSFYDEKNLSELMQNFRGTNVLSVKIRRPVKTGEDYDLIEKDFYVLEHSSIKAQNSGQSVIVLKLVEDIGFLTGLKEVNQTYSGTPWSIISSIITNKLQKRIVFCCDDKFTIFQENMKVIVPRLDPLEAANWVKNSSTASFGLPLFLFSTLADDYLTFTDLGTLYSQDIINPDYDFVYSQVAQNKNVNQENVIIEYDSTKILNTFDIFRQNLLSADYSFYDITTQNTSRFPFSIEEDVIQKLQEFNVLDSNRTSAVDIDTTIIIEGTPLSQFGHQISGAKKEISLIQSKIYGNEFDFIKSRNEETSSKESLQKVVARSLKKLLMKVPITVKLSGEAFISEMNRSLTTGKKIRLLFMANITDVNVQNQREAINHNLSGDYLIYMSRFIMTRDETFVILGCVKMENYAESFTQIPVDIRRDPPINTEPAASSVDPVFGDFGAGP